MQHLLATFSVNVLQGSGIGPSLYVIVIMESDLHSKSRNNKLMKYAALMTPIS